MANEKRLINAKPLMQSGWHLVQTGESNRFIQSMSLADIPTVDAVEVVRCKDCLFSRYFEESGTRKCRTMQGLYRTVEDDDFCSYGERKD